MNVRAWAIVILVGLLCGCAKKAPPQTSQVGSDGNDLCERPADVVLTDQELQLATAQIGKASVGGLKVNNNTKLVKVLAAGDNAALIVNYLMCEAERRGQLDIKDQARVDYTLRMLLFLHGTGTPPTAEQFDKWLKENPAPAQPTARLDTPNFISKDGKLRFPIPGESLQQTFTLLNGGKVSLNAWVAQYPQDKIMFAPMPGPFRLEPGKSVDVKLGIICCTAPTAPLAMRVQSDVPSEIDVEIDIGDPKKIATAFNEMTEAFAVQMDAALSSLQTDPPGVMARRIDASQQMAQIAFDSLRRSHPELDDRLAWGMSGSMLESMNWPGAAVEAYRKARRSAPVGDESFDVPLARSLYFAGLAPRNEFGEVELASLWKPHEQTPGLKATNPFELQLAASNVLALPSNRTTARRVLSVLESQPVFARFASGLRGDLLLADENNVAAAVEFGQCYDRTNAPSCALRNVEASAAAADVPATRAALEKLGQRHSDRLSRVLARRGMEELMPGPAGGAVR